MRNIPNEFCVITHLRISISIRIAYPDKKWDKLNNAGAILVVSISIRINFVCKGVRIESLSEPFYPDTEDFLQYNQKSKMYVHPNIIKNGLHYLSFYFVLN